MAVHIDVVVGILDAVRKSLTFVHFVGMPIAPRYKLGLYSLPQTVPY